MNLGYTNEGEGAAGTSFTSLITGLKPSTRYYVRAYAKNSAGRTGYGDPQFSFTTTDGGSPVSSLVTTTAIISIAPDGATVRGNANSDSASVIAEKGFYCSETSPPTLDDKKWTYDYSGSGDFEVKITGLKPVTKYYVVAYAKTVAGKLLYGTPQLSFITASADTSAAPSVMTTAVSEIKSDSATVTGKITGGVSVTAKGFCWSLSENPTLNNSLGYTNEGEGLTGIPFASLITGLDSGTKYYVRAYATNIAGKTGYGDPQLSFTTPPWNVTLPMLATVAVNSVTLISATVTGKIISDGGASVTAKGFCWSMLENPTLNNCFGYTNEGGATADKSFTGMITGLSSGTTYYVRAYATNSYGKTGYGDPQLSFNTNTGDTVILTQLSDITYQGAKISGKVLLSNVAEAGICYSETSPPTVDDKKLKALSSAIGNFELTLTGLDAATKYYVRPYAIDSKEKILYGLPQLSFVTEAYADGDESPTVTTLEVRDVTSAGATVTGKVVSDGGYSVMIKGFCWSTSENPTLENRLDFTEEEGGAAGIPFTSLITGMIPDTKYYVRAYAVNSAGKTGYGYPQFSFITKIKEVTAPTVATSVINSVTSSTAAVTGKVLSDGGASLTAKGFCWGLSENPTPASCLGYTNEGGGSAGFSFTSSITGLSGATSYYVRAYATNSKGTGYGDPQLSFTTLPPGTTLSVTTDSVTAVKSDGATVRGKIASDIPSAIIERGVCCSETSPPTLDSKWNAASGGTGDFEVLITGLKPVTQYYVRVYAIDSNGNITYGKPQLSFVTDEASPDPPTTETVAVTRVTETGATVTGKIVSDGGAAITKKGFCWGLSENPTLDKCLGSTDQGAGETGVSFTGAVSGLSPETTYYVRAFATNSAGETGYGALLSFTTEDASVITYPSVTTIEVIPVALNAATVNGKVVSDGGAAITTKGFCWGLSENPTTDDCLGYTNESGGSADGVFTSSITALTCNTKYYIRAYAKNSAEKTGYGTSLSFSIPCIPDVILRTSFIGDITGTGMTVRVSLTLNGGAAITEKGVCCSESSPPTIWDKWKHASSESEPGDFEIKITGLKSDTKYYIRAYAIDADGKTLYYEEQQFSFTTLDTEFPTVETVKVTDIKANSVIAQGRILSDGGAAITAKGFCWAISKNPTLDNCLSSTNQGAGTTDTFTGSITGLTPDTAYYVRAYATNSSGKTGYGSDFDFKTPSVPSSLKGDVDKNGIVDLGDAILILKVLTGKSASGIHNMDVNGDNMLGIADVIYIFRELSKQTM
ncbi:MAG: hypothetical protein BWK80_46245 [Desulfobacteraceae bacterium IS3]|nr:MAG: hypothetical protein BWK80_46245 [Desulfobacteraceae bacterium IS3]